MRVNNFRYEALMEALQAFEKKNEGVRIYGSWRRSEPCIKFQINWGGWGSQDPEVAEKYAAKLLKAARIAKALNSMEITRSLVDVDPVIDSEEKYYQLVNVLVKDLELEQFGLLKSLIDEEPFNPFEV